METRTWLQEELASILNGHWYDNYFSARCPNPKHKDTKPSLLVYPDLAICRGCGQRWTLQHLYNFLKGSPSKVVRDPGAPQSFYWKNTNIYDLAEIAHITLLKFSASVEYLKKRGVEGRIERNRLGWYMGYYTIPVMGQKNELLRVALRAGPEIEKYVTDRYTVSPGEWDVYVPDWKLIQKSKVGFLTFGLFDALAISQLRFPVASTLHGKSANIDRLKSFGIKWMIIPDLGEISEAHVLAARLGWAGGVVNLHYPSDTKDPSDMIEAGYTEYLVRELGRH